MDKTLIASAKTTVNASAENVWKVLTTPESIKLFLFGTDVTTDWKTESHIKFVGEYNGQTYEDKGIVIINEPFSLLEYSYWSSFSGLADKPENYSMVSYRIKKIDENSCEFTWHQQGFSSEEGKCHTENGLATMLEQIKGLAESA